jgi:IS5 family transposase
MLGQKPRPRSEENAMRRKINIQIEFDFQPSTLEITNEYYSRYERISRILGETPEIVDLVHSDLRKILKKKKHSDPGRECEFSSDTVVRIVICQIIEGTSLRDTVVRIDDSNYLRRFIRIYNGSMMSFTTFCELKNAIRPKTWKKINDALARAAIERELISGDRARLDTTAYETNIHWPTDSSLLWDTYRAIARLIESARELDPEVTGKRRLQLKNIKKLHTTIARRSGQKGVVSKAAKKSYKALIGRVDDILEWATGVCDRLQKRLDNDRHRFLAECIEDLIKALRHFSSLGLKVVDQARRRVLQGEQVPNEEKIFSIFEPHTELLKRGKAGKPIEFGHMVSIQQVEEKFITDYEVFKNKPVDYELVDAVLERHREFFGEYPKEFSADKGFYESMEKIKKLEKIIDTVAICKKGSRTEEEAERESSLAFRSAQKFRAGVEGSISFLKRLLGMWRCMNKGWEHYVATVGATIFTHNLLILSRGYG